MEGSIQLKGNQIFCWIIFQPYPCHNRVHRMASETRILLQRSGLCAKGQRLWALDAGVVYSASTEQQPKGTAATWIGSSSGKEKSPKESSYCPVVAWAHSLTTSTTRAGQDCKEAHSPWHLCKTGQGDPLYIYHWITSGTMENQALCGANQNKNMGCRSIYYVN